jgi:hypothetical protein
MVSLRNALTKLTPESEVFSRDTLPVPGDEVVKVNSKVDPLVTTVSVNVPVKTPSIGVSGTIVAALAAGAAKASAAEASAAYIHVFIGIPLR